MIMGLKPRALNSCNIKKKNFRTCEVYLKLNSVNSFLVVSFFTVTNELVKIVEEIPKNHSKALLQAILDLGTDFISEKQKF